jgi:cobalt/nickel transport system permease protein
MHIPDGFLDGATAAATGAVSAAAVGYGLHAARDRLDDRQVPVIGLTAAFVFAVQMVNFPVGLGTSGHLIGGALAAILLGPWMACLTLAVVLIVQALAFADGGITALGANICLMGLVAGVGGSYLFRGLVGVLPRTRKAFLSATAVTAWATVVGASAVASAFIWLGGPFGPEVLPVMIGLHALIGVGEAAITVAVVSAVLTARPDLVAAAPRDPRPARTVVRV